MKVKFLYLHRGTDRSEGGGDFREALLRARGTIRSNKPASPTLSLAVLGTSGQLLYDNTHKLPFRSGLATSQLKNYW